MYQRILVLCRYLPDATKSSGELRFSHVLRLLRERSERVELFCETGGNAHLYTDWPVYSMDELAGRCTGADLAVLEFWFMDLYMPTLRAGGVPIVVDSVDIEFLRRDRETRLLGLPQDTYAADRERELEAYRTADQIWVVSTEDAEQIPEHSSKTAVIPNIMTPVDTVPSLDERDGIVFVGSYHHQPNVDGLRWYRDEIMPRLRPLPHTFVGNGAPEDLEAMAGFRGGVENSRELVSQARVSIAPLRYGAGLKGKVLEAAGCGTPIVTTSIGDEGYDAAASGAAILANEPQEFAAAIERLADSPALWHRMSAAGVELADRFTPQRVGELIDEALIRLNPPNRPTDRKGVMRPTPGELLHAPAVRNGERVCIVVVNWNGLPFLRRALGSIVEHTADEDYELVVIDNASSDGSREYLGRFEAPGSQRLEVVFNEENRFFSATFNQGFNAASPEARYLMVFCNDVEAKSRGWLRDYVTAIRQPGIIAAGHAKRQRLLAEHRRLFLEERPRYRDAATERAVCAAVEDESFEYDHIFGYCFLLDRALLPQTGLYLTQGAFRQYHSDWELYLRVQALGYKIASIEPRVHHWHSISELIEFYPDLYADLVERLDDPELVAEYHREGRPLYRQESGYRAPQRDEAEPP